MEVSFDVTHLKLKVLSSFVGNFFLCELPMLKDVRLMMSSP
jgi:hypothetical protein